MAGIFSDRGRLTRAIGLLVRPLARLCIRNQLSIKDFFETCKEVFVDVAQEEITKHTKKVNASRISLMTGLYRRDVMRILRQDEPTKAEEIGVPMQVVDTWQRKKKFMTPSGNPRVISWEGDDSEFFQLVRVVSKNYNPATVLFELERLGVVSKTLRGLRLEKKFFGSSKDLERGLQILAMDYDDMLQAVLENLEHQPKVTNLHLRTVYDNLYVESLPDLRKWIESEGKKFHEKVRNHLAKFDKDVVGKDGEAGERIALGTYSASSYFESLERSDEVD